MANTTEHITIRVPSDLAQRIRARAQDEGRSLSGMVVRLVQHAMTGRVPPPKTLEGIEAARYEAALDYKCADPDEKEEAKRRLDRQTSALDDLAAQILKPERTVEYEE